MFKGDGGVGLGCKIEPCEDGIAAEVGPEALREPLALHMTIDRVTYLAITYIFIAIYI